MTKIQFLLGTALLFTAVSCKKENSLDVDDATVNQAVVANMEAISVATAGGDSIYVVNTCDRGSKRDSIAFSSLPSAAANYLTANYAGFTAQKAFSIKNPTGTVSGYVAIIIFNGKPVGVAFDATGKFLKVLEQREGRNLRGHGWHHGGHFDDRGGSKKDTIALSALPTSIKSYFATNHAKDTLVRAFRNRDSSIVVLSVNNGLFATVFNAAGTFIIRTQLPAKQGNQNSVELSALPSKAQTYLTATYPNFVFKHGFKITVNGAVQGYVAFIDANNTKYAVRFDAAGTLVRAVTIR